MQINRKHFPILILLTIALLIGVLTVRQYGESWDELQFYKYADRALQAYSTWPRTGTVPLTGNTYDNYGPAYVMLVALGARLLGLFIPWITSDLRHLLYLITYLIGIWAFHRLARRWLAELAAFGATLLFATQPLFWGHAFISPKDIPFLTFFLLSLEFGFRMVDALPGLNWDTVGSGVQRSLPILTAGWLTLFLGTYAGTQLIHQWIDVMIRAASVGQTNVFSYLASDIGRVNPAVYTERYFVLFIWFRTIFFFASGVLLIWLWSKAPSVLRLLMVVVPAALLLGLTTSIRVLGPFAGLIVAGYAIWKVGKKAILPLATYAVVASIAMYLSWPYLWPSPIGHLMESVRIMSEYPWRGQVLFNGVMYTSTDIPRSYLPVLLGIQLTEPIWFLFAAGLLAIIYATVRHNERSRALVILTSVWFILPLIGFVATRSPLYDNFRQVFFILPPVFLVTGAAFEKIKPPILQAALIGLMVLPGLIEGAPLHPYEYVYYNRFIGGVHGADRRFELDYWATSYREAADYLNGMAVANGTVWVEGPAHLLQLYLRPDLKVYSTGEVERAEHYDYVVSITRGNLDLRTYPDGPILHTIERDDAAFTVIKKP